MFAGVAARLGFCALAALLAFPALANDQAAPPASSPPQAVPSPGAPRVGRYTMVPAGGGFVRLDTETGTVSHCQRETDAPEASWRCAAVPENILSRPDRIAELEEEVDTLSREVAALRMRLDARDRQDAAAPPAARADPDFDKALDFSEELMRRFFGMVREMKRADEDRT